MLDLVLDAVADDVDGFPEELDQVEVVRAYLRDVLAGRVPPDAPKRELHFVFGLLITAFDLDCRCGRLRADLEEELEELLNAPALASDAGCSYCHKPSCA